MHVTTGRGGIRNRILLKVSSLAGAMVLIASSIILYSYRNYEIADLVTMSKRDAVAVMAAASGLDTQNSVAALVSKTSKDGTISIVSYSPAGNPISYGGGHATGSERWPTMPDDSVSKESSSSSISWDGRIFAVSKMARPLSDGNLIYAFSDITEHISAIDFRAVRMALAALSAEIVLFGILIVVAGLGDRKLVESEKEQMAMESELFFLAHYDTLTHLPNRTLFWERADAAISRAARLGKAVAVMSFDIDGFGAVNDERGRSAGDRILMETAQRIQAACRNSDLVCRTGPDEFTVIMEDLDSDRAFEGIDRLKAQIERAVEPEILEAFGPISIRLFGGAAAFPFHGSNSEEIFARAHLAMAKAKEGKSSFAMYSPEHSEKPPAAIGSA